MVTLAFVRSAGSIPASPIFKRLYYKTKKEGISIRMTGVCAALAPNTIIEFPRADSLGFLLTLFPKRVIILVTFLKEARNYVKDF